MRDARLLLDKDVAALDAITKDPLSSIKNLKNPAPAKAGTG